MLIAQYFLWVEAISSKDKKMEKDWNLELLNYANLLVTI